MIVYWIVGSLPTVDYPGNSKVAWAGKGRKVWVGYTLGFANETNRLCFNRGGPQPHSYKTRKAVMEAKRRLLRSLASEGIDDIKVVDIQCIDTTKYYLVGGGGGR